MALEEHALWPIQSELTASRHEEESRTTLMGTSFEERQQGEKSRDSEYYSPEHHDFITINLFSFSLGFILLFCHARGVDYEKRLHPTIDLQSLISYSAALLELAIKPET